MSSAFVWRVKGSLTSNNRTPEGFTVAFDRFVLGLCPYASDVPGIAAREILGAKEDPTIWHFLITSIEQIGHAQWMLSRECRGVAEAVTLVECTNPHSVA